MTLVVLVALWCVVLCVWLWIRPRHVEPPTYPGSLPIIGHAHILATSDLITIWEKERKVYQSCIENNGVMKIIEGPVTIYMLTDPDDCHLVSNACIDKPYFYGFGKEMYSEGLVTSDPQTWKLHRKFLNPVFNQQVIYSFITEYCRQAKQLVFDLECKVGKEPFDIQHYLDHNVLTLAYHTTLGVDNSDASESINEYAKATKGIFELYFNRGKKIWLHLPQLFRMSSLKKKEDMLMATLKDITNKALKERKSEFKQNIKTAKYKSMLDRLLEISETQHAFTDEEIRAHLDTMLAATYDTTATALTFIFILIGSYPEVQERIFKELQEVLGGDNRDMTRHDLSKLVYLEAVIKESLRLYPPTPRVGRITESALKLRNYTIPAHSILIVSLYGVNRHPMWGPDANEFKPERWLNPSTLPANRHAFASFSLGKRNCIGKVHAMMAMKTIIAFMLQKYRVKGDIHNVKTICDALIKPVSGHHISLEMRM